MKKTSIWLLLSGSVILAHALTSCISAPKVVAIPDVRGIVVDHETGTPVADTLVAVLVDKETFVFGTYSTERWDEYYTFSGKDGLFELPELKRIGSVSRTYMGKANAPTPQLVLFKAGYKLKTAPLGTNATQLRRVSLRRLPEGRKNPHGEARRLVDRLVEHAGSRASSDDRQALLHIQRALTYQ